MIRAIIVVKRFAFGLFHFLPLVFPYSIYDTPDADLTSLFTQLQGNTPKNFSPMFAGGQYAGATVSTFS